MLKSFMRAKAVVDEVLGLGHSIPPMAPALATVPVDRAPSAGRASYGVAEMVEDMRILLGVPKYRTSKPKKTTRKFSYTRLLSPVDDIVTCSSCGGLHQSNTICGNCYQKVRTLTNEIKRKMMDYNPYKGERQDKQVFVKFNNDELDEGVLKGKRVLEMDRERPSWFKKIFQ